MKKLLFLILISFISFSCGTGDSKTTLDINFTKHPSDGTNVNSINSIFEAERNFDDLSTIFHSPPEPKDIEITVEWWWQSGDKSETMMIDTDTYFITSDFDQISTLLRAGDGYVFVNYYWLSVSWEDDDGFHSIDSRKGFYNTFNKESYTNKVEVNTSN